MLNWPSVQDPNKPNGTHTLELSRDAFDEWHAFAQVIEEKMRPGGSLEHFTDWGGKAPGAAARLAGVLHGIKHAHASPWAASITKETMHAALNIMAVFVEHSRAAMSIMGADPSIAAATQVWDWIERNRLPHFTVRDAFNALRGSFPRSSMMKSALETLAERGYMEIIEPPRDGPGRPPSPMVRVRPEIVESWL